MSTKTKVTSYLKTAASYLTDPSRIESALFWDRKLPAKMRHAKGIKSRRGKLVYSSEEHNTVCTCKISKGVEALARRELLLEISLKV